MNTKIEKILSLPKSLYVCLRLLPIKEAFRLPILVRYNVRLLSLKGKVVLVSGERKFGVLQIGFGQVGVFDKKYSRSIMELNGTVNLLGNGRFLFGHGCKICVGREGTLTVGSGFTATAEATIICMNKITIGNHVTFSWNTLVMDTDFHPVVNVLTNEKTPITKSVMIEDNVWLCTRAVVLKGSLVGRGCVIGANAVVSSGFSEPNMLIVGNPAIVKKRNVTKGD